MSDAPQHRLRPHPSVRFAENEQTFSLDREIDGLLKEQDAGQHGHRQKALFAHGPMTVALYAFEAGSRLPDHVVDGDVIIQVLEGHVVVSTGETDRHLHSGQILVLAPGVRHDLAAEEASRLLMTFCLERSYRTGPPDDQSS
jgi:quercetin dioxygenase-like cupin family protein